MNTIQWRPKALKQARKIKDIELRARIFDEVQVLKDFPNCAGVKHLTRHVYGYRLRIGDYRVFFDFQGGETRIISIEQVRKRNERTY